MNEIIKSLEERRSIRAYKSDMPKAEDIDKIIEAGLYAPTGMGYQKVIILAVTDKETRDSLSEDNRAIAGMKEGTDPFYGAPVVLVVLAAKDMRTHVYDGSLVMGNMLNAAHALGLGSCWVHRAKEEFEMEKWQNLLKKLGIEGEWEGIGHCIVGYPDGEAPKAAERAAGRVYKI